MSIQHAFLLPIDLELPSGWRASLLNGKQLILQPSKNMIASFAPDVLESIANDLAEEDAFKYRTAVAALREIALAQRAVIAEGDGL